MLDRPQRGGDIEVRDMKNAAFVLVAAAAISACGGPELTKEASEVRSITDASACRLIKSSYLESRPQFIQDYVKRNVAEMGGDAYKIINVGQDAAMGQQISQVSFEAYDCRK